MIERAISQLPDEGQIRRGQLEWTNASPIFLAASPQFAILVDATATEGASRVADVQLEFHQRDMKICSLFGCLSLAYPTNFLIGLNRLEAAPAWGAWKPALFAGLVAATVAGLFASWLALSADGLAPLRLLAYLADREATQSDCWRLGFMALMPGALMMMIAIFLYGAERIKLTDLLIVWPLHLVIGLGYAIGAILFLPTAGTTPVKTANPFAPGCSPAVSRSAAESPPPRS